ncbi:hypothetical protein ACIBTP_35480 [Streptomyces avidinii]|uniref:hypothetical protein n=1 Tax=Streptomyces avidinii TaxID=1895 RepID=UPI0037A53F78
MGKQWWTAVGVNLLLGIPGVVPVWLLWYLAVNWPLAALGWTEREATENDGVLPWLVIAAPVVLVFALLWWLTNRALRRRRTAPAFRLYWPVCALATLLPSFALMIAL